MLTPTDIRNMEFQKTSIGGYKPMDVDCFLEEIANTVEKAQKENAEMLEKLNVLANRIEEYRKDEDSIHTALLNAQRLADKVLKDAKEQAEILQSSAQKRADEIVNAANAKAESVMDHANKSADYLTKTTKKNVDKMTSEAKEKTERMIAAAVDSVNRQQQNFNQIKAEVASFRTNLLARYKTHVEMITLIPNEVPADPAIASEQVAKDFEKNKEKIMKQAEEKVSVGEAGPDNSQNNKSDTQEIEIPKELDIDPEMLPKAEVKNEGKPQTSMFQQKPELQPQEKKQGFKVVVEEEESANPLTSGLKFGGDFSPKTEIKEEETTGFGFFKKRK